VFFRGLNGDMRPLDRKTKEMQGTFDASKEGLEPIEFETYSGERMPLARPEWPPNIQKLWNERCKSLHKAGYLAKEFLIDLQRYCFAVYQAEEAERHLIDEGFLVDELGTKGQVYTVVSKWITVLDNANKTIDKVGNKFGFSPLAVQKIPAVVKEESKMSLLK